MSNYVMAVAAIFCLYWVSKSKNRVTKFAGLALGLSILLRFLSFAGLDQYAIYAFAFFTLFAGFEPVGSFRFKNKHKTVFLYAAIVSFILLLEGIVNVPLKFPLELFMIPIPLLLVWMWVWEKKVIYQRVGFLVVWSTQALLTLYSSEWIRACLAELF